MAYANCDTHTHHCTFGAVALVGSPLARNDTAMTAFVAASE